MVNKLGRLMSWEKIYRGMVYILPGVLCFSYYPVIVLGGSESMNFELSLPLIWLVVFNVVVLTLMLKKRKLVEGMKGKWWWLLFPGFLSISVAWSLNPVRGVLTGGILWLVYFAIYGMWSLRGLLSEVGFKDKFWKVFFGSYLVVCAWCVVQCVMDLAGAGRDVSLMCAGCTYRMFGFPHPNGFAIEPQFMGNLLLAPAIVSIWMAMKKKKYYWLVFVFAAGIFLTFSRGAIYAFVVATIFMVTMEMVRQKTWRFCKTFMVVALAFLCVLGVQGMMAAMGPTDDTFGSGVAKVLNHLSLGIIDIRKAEKNGDGVEANGQTIEGTEEEEENYKVEKAVFDGYVEESTETRVKLSSEAVEAWKGNLGTVIGGVGLGGAGQALYMEGLSDSPKEIVQNEYVSLLLETGMIGVVLMMLTVVLIVRVVIKSKAMTMLLALMVAYGITLMFFSGLPNALHIYLLTGLFIVLSRDSLLSNSIAA